MAIDGQNKTLGLSVTMGYFSRERSSLDVFPDLIDPENTRQTAAPRTQPKVDAKERSAESSRRNQRPDRLIATVLSTTNSHRYGELYTDFLRARKKVFIDQKSWPLPQVDGMEFDQYDTPQSRAIVIHEFGQVVGGVRLLPTTARCGCYSYMLRDAQLGLIDDIPDYVLYEKAPVAAHIWEATRLFISSDVPTEGRMHVQAKLMITMASAAQKEGATHVIGIVPAVFQRWLGRLGISALPLGPKLDISGDKTQAAVLNVGGAIPDDHNIHSPVLLN